MDTSDFFIEDGIKIYKEEETFYNPAMKFNRDISLLTIKNYFKEHTEVRILTAMCASGLRGMRYLKEDKKNIVHFNDISENAINSLKKNLTLNGFLTSKVYLAIERNILKNEKLIITQKDCNVLMNELYRFYDVIDIDPFGSCNTFAENAFRSIKHNGIICFTCTDKAALCSKVEKCYTKYGSHIYKNFCKNETPIRVLLSFLSHTAARFDFSIEPLLSFSVDYYLRVIVRVKLGKGKDVIENTSHTLICKCGNFMQQSIRKKPENIICNTCQNPMNLYGPFWIKPYCDRKFIKQMLENLDDRNARLKGVLKYLEQEIDSPWYFESNKIAKYLKTTTLNRKQILANLEKRGFLFSLTHCDVNGFKTNAPLSVIFEIFKNSDHCEVSSTVETLLKDNFYKGLLSSGMKPGSLPKQKEPNKR